MITKTYKPDDVFRLMTRDLRDAAHAVVFVGWTDIINPMDIYEALKPVFDERFKVRVSRADFAPTDGSPVASFAIGFPHREDAIVGARAIESALCGIRVDIDPDVSGCEVSAIPDYINIEMWIGDARIDFHPSSPQRASFKQDNAGGDLK